MLGWCLGQARVSDSMTTVELLVDMDCEGCERRVRRAISKLDDVDSFDIDMDNQKVTVTGYVDPGRVIRAVRGHTGRRVEIWPPDCVDDQSDNEYYFNPSQYIDECNISNYYSHGYNGRVPYPSDPIHSTVAVDEMTEMFSEENVHACTIM